MFSRTPSIFLTSYTGVFDHCGLWALSRFMDVIVVEWWCSKTLNLFNREFYLYYFIYYSVDQQIKHGDFIMIIIYFEVLARDFPTASVKIIFHQTEGRKILNLNSMTFILSPRQPPLSFLSIESFCTQTMVLSFLMASVCWWLTFLKKKMQCFMSKKVTGRENLIN